MSGQARAAVCVWPIRMAERNSCRAAAMRPGPMPCRVPSTASAAPARSFIWRSASAHRLPAQCPEPPDTIKKIDTTGTPVHIECTVSQLENGAIDLATPLQSVIVVSDGTQW